MSKILLIATLLLLPIMALAADAVKKDSVVTTPSPMSKEETFQQQMERLFMPEQFIQPVQNQDLDDARRRLQQLKCKKNPKLCK